MDQIQEFIRFHRNLPSSLAKKLHAYNDFSFSINRGLEVAQIATVLPPNLQQDMFFHLHAHLVKQGVRACA